MRENKMSKLLQLLIIEMILLYIFSSGCIVILSQMFSVAFNFQYATLVFFIIITFQSITSFKRRTNEKN